METIKKFTLSNGLKVIHDQRKSNSVVIQVNVKVGNNYETKDNLGICHFIEHMLFEGTKKRDARRIAQEVEAMGGEINAATLNERTYYYVSVLKKYFDKGSDVLADMIQNPLFKEEHIQKEKKVVLDEIKVYNDDPNSYQFILFLENLYKKHPAKHSGLGTKETVIGLTRNKIIDFYKKYYLPNNITIVIVGDVKNVKQKIEKAFSNFEKGIIPKYISVKEPLDINKNTIIVNKEVEHSYYVFGYKTNIRSNKDSYILDIISNILGYGQSSRLFNEIRIKRGLGYSLGVINDLNKDYGYFAVFVSLNKEYVPTVREIIKNEIKLKDLNNEEIKQAKNTIEGSTLIKNENNKERADWISYWDLMGDYKEANNYFKKIKKINEQDVLKVIKRYFTGNYTETIIQEK